MISKKELKYGLPQLKSREEYLKKCISKIEKEFKKFTYETGLVYGVQLPHLYEKKDYKPVFVILEDLRKRVNLIVKYLNIELSLNGELKYIKKVEKKK